MDDLRMSEGISEEKLREAAERLRPKDKVTFSIFRGEFGVKGFRSISLLKWIKQIIGKRKE